MMAADREPVPTLPSLRGIVDNRTFSPRWPRKSTTTSARWAGPSRRSCRTTLWGSKPLPVPTWTNGRPLDSEKSYAEKSDAFRSRSR